MENLWNDRAILYFQKLASLLKTPVCLKRDEEFPYLNDKPEDDETIYLYKVDKTTGIRTSSNTSSVNDILYYTDDFKKTDEIYVGIHSKENNHLMVWKLD